MWERRNERGLERERERERTECLSLGDDGEIFFFFLIKKDMERNNV